MASAIHNQLQLAIFARETCGGFKVGWDAYEPGLQLAQVTAVSNTRRGLARRMGSATKSILLDYNFINLDDDTGKEIHDVLYIL